MALIRRVSRLLLADLHALLDQLEEPETLLRQAIREMEAILAGDKQHYKLLLHELEMLEQRAQEIRHALSGGENELDLCFENSQEALARDLIRRRLESESLLQALSARHDRVEKSCNELKAAIEQNHSRLQSTRQKAELFSVEKSRKPSQECWSGAGSRILDQEVELALLREKQKRGLS